MSSVKRQTLLLTLHNCQSGLLRSTFLWLTVKQTGILEKTKDSQSDENNPVQSFKGTVRSNFKNKPLTFKLFVIADLQILKQYMVWVDSILTSYLGYFSNCVFSFCFDYFYLYKPKCGEICNKRFIIYSHCWEQNIIISLSCDSWAELQKSRDRWSGDSLRSEFYLFWLRKF